MQKSRMAAGPVLLALSIVACSDSLSPESLAGTYDVTSMEFVNPANPSQTVDLMEPGVSYRIVIGANGSLTSLQDGAVQGTGTLTIDGDTFTLTAGSETQTGTITRNGDTVTLYYAGIEASWDWDDNPATPGTAADARLVMVKAF